MKRILLLSAFSVCAFMANAQLAAADPHAGHSHEAAAVANTTAEETLTLNKTQHDFGKIPQGKPVTYIFEVANRGKSAFKLDNVQASCGCTTPEWDKEKMLNPGEKSEIKVGYNAAAEGPFTKNITITYNGGQTKVIEIKGEVWKTPASSAPMNTQASELKN